jgi:hypothetical protein
MDCISDHMTVILSNEGPGWMLINTLLDQPEYPRDTYL